MRIDFLTIFPEILSPYLNASILKRAQEARCVRFATHDLRQWATGKHRKVDDTPYGGGPGMVMMLEPFFRALRTLRVKEPIARIARSRPWQSRPGVRILLTAANGRPFTERDAERYATDYDRLIILCGRYEGIDHRVAEYLVDESVSVGPYVLTGGELPALTIADAVTRLLPGVLGNTSSLHDESFRLPATDSTQDPRTSDVPLQPATDRWQLEHPHYTRPADFSPRPGVHWRVPDVLLGGNHAAITRWRAMQYLHPQSS